jgi:drug/metabolite transporter (DMT)-like permease
MAAIALGFGSALVWGAADFLGGLKSRKLALFAVMLVSQAAGVLPLWVAAAVRGEAPPGADILPWCALGAAAGTVGLAAFYRGLAVGQMGVVAPISSAAAAIPVAVGLASGERPGALQVAGIAVAIAGVVLVTWDPRGEGQTLTPPPPSGEGLTPPRSRMATGAGLAFVAALGFGFFFVGLDEASDRDLLWALVITRSMSTGALLLAALALRPPGLRLSAGDTRDVALVGILDVAANALFAAGTTLGLVSVVSVLGSLYPVTTILLARFILHERLRATQRGGAATALVGVALISAG